MGGGSPRSPASSRYPHERMALQDGEEIGPRMLARIARRTGLRPEDL
jgi:hypothetical protein